MLTELLLVRHALFDDSTARNPEGRWDPALSPSGREQAEALAARLEEHAFDTVVTSPLERCVETARILAKDRAAEPAVDPRLAEYHRGDFEGVFTTGTAAYRAAWRDGDWTAWPNGETRQAFRDRLAEALADLAAAGGRALVCTHSGVINELLCLALGVRGGTVFRLDTTGVTRLGTDGRQVVVAAVNDVWHLEDSLSVPLSTFALPGEAR